ncbi:hypothetical protein BN1804_00892 [Proteus penneri]|uniref:Uncharacterized protein n=1 Tax=Proteus penneri TaxID=102862 RepID=A0A0G4Q3A8_9GAMM|nr:hypothetical protein BN1804_00892 [Proteus penneri]SUC01999.1 Uncharacterised protein [Proteus penneri]
MVYYEHTKEYVCTNKHNRLYNNLKYDSSITYKLQNYILYNFY